MFAVQDICCILQQSGKLSSFCTILQQIRGAALLPRGQYNEVMARGWESKSVEEQQAEAASQQTRRAPPLTPAELAKYRQREQLLLSRRNVLQQLEAAHNPRHCELLQKALADLDSRLAQLG